MSQRAIPCTVMRGGTSKGLCFQAKHLPADSETRDRVLVAAMGSKDRHQVNGMGGGHTLTSKVAIISPASRKDADVDYLFLQLVPGTSEVRASQTCGNILAAVAQFAVEKALVEADNHTTRVRINLVNSNSVAVATIKTPDRTVTYEGDTSIDGVTGVAAPVLLEFPESAGSNCGALLPTGHAQDYFNSVAATCIDNGMPVVILNAADFGKTGLETPEELENDKELKHRIEVLRLAAGYRMNLGDVTQKTVPKMCLVTQATQGGVISTRTFIPHRVHESIGVLGAASVAAACLLPGSVAQRVSGFNPESGVHRVNVEHPTGYLTVELEMRFEGNKVRIKRSAILRTARKLMEGHVYVQSSVWSARAGAS